MICDICVICVFITITINKQQTLSKERNNALFGSMHSRFTITTINESVGKGDESDSRLKTKRRSSSRVAKKKEKKRDNSRLRSRLS